MTSRSDRRVTDTAEKHSGREHSGAGAGAMDRSRRPVFLNLMQIQMPVGALTSIGHRISGVVLATSIPVAVYLFALSLRDEAGFAQVSALFGQFAFKAATIIAVWAFTHHVLGGVRHLLTDFDIGSPMRVARRSAWFVNLAGVAVTLLAAGLMW